MVSPDLGRFRSVQYAIALLFFVALLPIDAFAKPRIMVVIPETHIARRIPDPAGETEVIRRLVEDGFRVVDQKQVAKIRENQQKMQELLGNIDAAAALGLEYGAEIIIYGEAFSETAPPQFGMQSVRARVEARAVRCDTAEIIAAHGLEAGAADTAEFIAAKKALKNAGGLIADYMIEQFSKRAAPAQKTVTVTIAGVQFTQLTKIEAAIREKVAGVALLERRSYSNGLATLEVELTDSDALIASLSSGPIAGVTLSVVNNSAGRIDLQIPVKAPEQKGKGIKP